MCATFDSSKQPLKTAHIVHPAKTAPAPFVSNVALHQKWAADAKDIFLLAVKAAKHFRTRDKDKFLDFLYTARIQYNHYLRQCAIINASC